MAPVRPERPVMYLVIPIAGHTPVLLNCSVYYFPATVKVFYVILQFSKPYSTYTFQLRT